MRFWLVTAGHRALTIRYRPIERADVPAVVAMLADDPLGAKRERSKDPIPDCYWQAYEAIEQSAASEIIIAERAGEVVGCLTLNIHLGLARQGMRRAQIEAVRVKSGARGDGIGEGLCREAIDRAVAKQCGLVELTTDKSRSDAHRFYERLGFQATHIGMKLIL